ncbi:hypothetical protein LXL04_033790 [Taraxacum kok-saghyz]
MTEKSRAYRPWTTHEDAKLVEALLNMVNTGGYKADNGFKSGYLQHLGQALKESLPASGLLPKPHIESRIRTMKKEWQIVYDMITGNNTSGFGYDSVNRCGTVESPEVWDAYVKVHKGAEKWRNKQIPHYDDLCIIFGKDRAQGNRAEDCEDMSHNANVDEELLDMEDDFNEQNEETSPTTNVQSEETSSASSKKRKRKDPFIEGISNALQKKTSMVTAEILKIPSMNQSDKFKASRKIMREPEAVLTFWNLEGEDRETFDSITAQVLAAKRATEFNYSTIQLQQYSITAEFNYSTFNSSALQPTKQALIIEGFSEIYIGQLFEPWQNQTAAFKRLRLGCNNEVEMMSMFNHENLIRLIGCCDEDNELIMVYEYAFNGSLDQHLQDINKRRSLTWPQRLKICLGDLADQCKRSKKDRPMINMITRTIEEALHIQCIVAIKRLNREGHQGKKEFLTEINLISRFRHENMIIPFVGYCDEENEMILFYKYASNGSLDYHLYDPNKRRCLTWARRLKICLGVARGLNYLHSCLGDHNRVIHRDVKSGNILLDENLEAKICDFGLSKEGLRNQQLSQIYTKAAGTNFYQCPIYRESNILHKESNVYSFGVVLFEMLTGMLAYHEKDSGDVVASKHVFKDIAYQCISYHIEERPTMDKIVERIEDAIKF